MVLAWKKFHRSEALMLRFIASVCALLPNVLENARNNAITAMTRAIFLFDPAACSMCSAFSTCSCASAIAVLRSFMTWDDHAAIAACRASGQNARLDFFLFRPAG